MQFLFIFLLAFFVPLSASAQTPTPFCEQSNNYYAGGRCSNTYNYVYATYDSNSNDCSTIDSTPSYQCNLACGSKTINCYLVNDSCLSSPPGAGTSYTLCGPTPTIAPSPTPRDYCQVDFDCESTLFGPAICPQTQYDGGVCENNRCKCIPYPTAIPTTTPTSIPTPTPIGFCNRFEDCESTLFGPAFCDPKTTDGGICQSNRCVCNAVTPQPTSTVVPPSPTPAGNCTDPLKIQCSDTYNGLFPNWVNYSGANCTGSKIAPWPSYPTDYKFYEFCKVNPPLQTHQYNCRKINSADLSPTTNFTCAGIDNPYPTIPATCVKSRSLDIFRQAYRVLIDGNLGNFNCDAFLNGVDYVIWRNNGTYLLP